MLLITLQSCPGGAGIFNFNLFADQGFVRHCSLPTTELVLSAGWWSHPDQPCLSVGWKISYISLPNPNVPSWFSNGSGFLQKVTLNATSPLFLTHHLRTPCPQPCTCTHEPRRALTCNRPSSLPTTHTLPHCILAPNKCKWQQYRLALNYPEKNSKQSEKQNLTEL